MPDSRIIIATGNDRQYADTCRILGVPELAEDERFLRNADRVRNRDALMPMLLERSRHFTKAELLERLEAAHVPAGPINSLCEVFADAQVAARALRVDLPASDAAAGTVPGVRNPIVLSQTPLTHEHAAPRHAEHTREVLLALGFGEEAIARMSEAGVISTR